MVQKSNLQVDGVENEDLPICPLCSPFCCWCVCLVLSVVVVVVVDVGSVC